MSHRLEPTLRDLGERGDIVKAINRALSARGQERDLGSYVPDAETGSAPVVGRVIDKRLGDELGDRVSLVIDGLDGRVHHVKLPDGASAEQANLGAIVEVARGPSQSPADRTIAELARGTGEYRPSVHRDLVQAQARSVPGRDYDAYVSAHIRRLEALRRAGIVQRLDATRWQIPEDFEARAAEYDAARGTGVRVRVLSGFDLDQQVASDGATWLDRHIVNSNPTPVARNGFGAEVLNALEQRKTELVRRGQAWRTSVGEFRATANLIETLRRQEVERVGRQLASERGLAFNSVQEGETVRGKLLGSVQLASGLFAMIDDGLGFSLVPWRPVIEQEVGREVIGVMRAGDVSWQRGRARGLAIGL